MGILNITPDSFFEKSRVNLQEHVLLRAEEMIKNGATILDIGGHSTRPNAAFVSEEEELARVLPIISTLRNAFPEIILSIDTYRLNIAKEALNAGADIFNDIGCGNMDEGVLDWVGTQNIPYVLSHSVGLFQEVHQVPAYSNILHDVWLNLAEKVKFLRSLGHSNLLIDPGFGFSKTLEHNYELLAQLKQFKTLGAPILVGVSRKTMICKLLNIRPEEALSATTALHMFSLLNGADLLRVHDVNEAREVVELYEKLKWYGLSNLSK